MSMGCARLVGALRTRQTRVASRAAQRGPARRARRARTSGWLRSARRIWLKLSPVSPLRYLTESLSSDRLSVSSVGHARTAAATSATSSHRRKYSTLVRMEGAYTSVWRGCACVVECEWQKGARGGAQASEVGGRKSVRVCVWWWGGAGARAERRLANGRARAHLEHQQPRQTREHVARPLLAEPDLVNQEGPHRAAIALARVLLADALRGRDDDARARESERVP